MSKVHELSHPLAEEHLSHLRNVNSSSEGFRNAVTRLSYLLVIQATQDLELRTESISTPVDQTEVQRLSQRVGFVPIIRAGLGMLEAGLELIPDAETWHVGLYRDELTSQAIEYYNRLPQAGGPDVALVLDPMLATAGSACAAIDSVKRSKSGTPVRIKMLSLVAAPEGVARLQASHPDVDLHVAKVDRALNTKNYVMPGLGDAGDRTFNTEQK